MVYVYFSLVFFLNGGQIMSQTTRFLLSIPCFVKQTVNGLNIVKKLLKRVDNIFFAKFKDGLVFHFQILCLWIQNEDFFFPRFYNHLFNDTRSKKTLFFAHILSISKFDLVSFSAKYVTLVIGHELFVKFKRCH